MILLVTNSRDITTDFIVAELRRRGAPFYRFNGDLADQSDLRFSVDERGTTSWSLLVDGNRVDANLFHSGYFRRPALPKAEGLDPRYASQVYGEWSALLNSFYGSLQCRWFSEPSSIARAEDKPRQLAVAARLGFAVPSTLVTNGYGEVAAFVGSRASVAKPLKSGRLTESGDEEVAFTSFVDHVAPTDESSIRLSPVIYQTALRKAADLRVTVVRSRVFACEIKQTDPDEIDWRKLDAEQLHHTATELPHDVADLCVKLVKELGLGFGAIDLVRDGEGKHWFLEINPNGQWAWIERRAGLPIAAAIVDEMVGTSA